jgi:hypothetical protein
MNIYVQFVLKLKILLVVMMPVYGTNIYTSYVEETSLVSRRKITAVIKNTSKKW